jgi:TPR repeat protein
MGLMYQHGEGVENNARKARELFEEARRVGVREAALQLGVMYQQGEGVEKNAKKAVELYEEARRAGDDEAAFNLGIMYWQGKGVEKNTKKAGELFEEARHAGDHKATFNLGLMYQHGEGVEKNARKACELYEESRRAGVQQAARALGLLYLEGQGIKKDFAMAKALFEEASRGGDAAAAFHLAQLVDHIEKHLEEGNKGMSSGQTQSSASIPRPARPSCAACGAEGKCLKLCTGCRRTWYCSVHCQRQHRGVHKDICRHSRPGTGQATPPQPCDPVVAVSKPASPAHVVSTPFSPDFTPRACQASADYATAAAASFDEIDAHAAAENGQIADAILRSRCAPSAVRGVVLLEFSRDPRSFHEALRDCPALKECRDALENAGAIVELPSLAKVYVPPEVYDATMEAVRIFGLELQARHVIAWPGIEETVTIAAENRAAKVKLQGRAVIPLGLAAASVQAGAKIEVTRTFVHTKIPSSLCSEHSGPVTASTTDAHSRFGLNVRTHGPREARSSADI